MEYYSTHINKLIEQLSHLPGIGPKSAQRLAFHIMNMPKDQVEQLTSSITGAREKIRYCKKCCTLTDQELCPICSNPKRDASTIMVVENTRDLAAYEKTGQEQHGHYFSDLHNPLPLIHSCCRHAFLQAVILLPVLQFFSSHCM